MERAHCWGLGVHATVYQQPHTLVPLTFPPQSLFRYPAEPPKGGKGCRIEDAGGVAAATDRMPMLKVIQMYRSRETVKALAPAVQHHRSLDGVQPSHGSKDLLRVAGRQQRAIRPTSAPITPSGKWQDSNV